MSAMYAEDRPYRTDEDSVKALTGRPVREEADRLQKAIHVLDERLDALANRLDPVLRPGDAILGRQLESVPRETQSPLAEQARTAREHISMLESRVESILDRLQV